MSSAGAALLVNQAPAAAFEPIESMDADARGLLPAIAPIEAPAAADAGNDSFEVIFAWPVGGSLADRLVHAGIAPADSRQASAAVEAQFGGRVPDNADVKLSAGLGAAGKRPILGLSVLSDLGEARFSFDGGQLHSPTPESGLRRHNLRLNKHAYWTLRELGIDGSTAGAVLSKANQAGKDEILKVVVGTRPNRFGKGGAATLLYAAAGEGRHLKEWVRTIDAEGRWITVSGSSLSLEADALMRPVSGRLSSRFGHRSHPILGFIRMHNGVDYAAAWGTPVRAAADGRIAAAEWRGGYGRQVRIAHDSALATSYSHLAEMRVEPGEWVRKGDVIGLVGSSGLATGPHLHFELYRGSQPVDPLIEGVSDPSVDDQWIRTLLERYRRVAAA